MVELLFAIGGAVIKRVLSVCINTVTWFNIPYYETNVKQKLTWGCVRIWGRITLIRGVRHPQMPNGATSGDATSSFSPKNERTPHLKRNPFHLTTCVI